MDVTNTMKAIDKKPWYKSMPDPMVLIFLILVAAYLLTFIVPAGEFERAVIDGRTTVVPGSFHLLDNPPSVHFFDIFVAIPQGLINAAPYLFIVFIAGGLFHMLQKTGALENAIGVAVHKAGVKNRNVIITVGTFIYGFFGVAVGFENNIALIPVAILISSAVGYSSLVGTTMAVGGIGLGFALSPINPYTVGVAQTLAELPLFSGAWLRTIMTIVSLAALSWYICARVSKMDYVEQEGAEGLSKDLSEYAMDSKSKLTLLAFVGGLGIMLYGVFAHNWYINEIAAIFLMVAIAVGIINGLGANGIVKEMIEGASGVTGGALVIGMAASIQVILKDAMIIDTIVASMSEGIQTMPVAIAAVVASVVQGIINLFIPGGSGQALATMPIMIPVADLAGMSRQLMISAFQVGDGLTNLIVPTSGGTLAMLALGRVSYEQWLKAILPFMVIAYLIAWAGLVVGHMVGY
ncbi:YfcC family protein [Vibrio sp.]|nr:YfcC family protein [Vibrio sp.]